MRKILATSILAALVAAPALAQPPQVMEQGGARYASGGVGSESRDAMLEMRGQFNLHLTFAAKKSGDFLADVRVTVREAGGRELLEATSDGPLFYASLAPGSYRVSAAYAGATQTRSVKLSAKGRRELYFYW